MILNIAPGLYGPTEWMTEDCPECDNGIVWMFRNSKPPCPGCRMEAAGKVVRLAEPQQLEMVL